MDYSPYSDKAIRNKDVLTDEEQALVDFQANEEADLFLHKFRNEPKFLKRVAPKLAERLLAHLSPGEK